MPNKQLWIVKNCVLTEQGLESLKRDFSLGSVWPQFHPVQGAALLESNNGITATYKPHILTHTCTHTHIQSDVPVFSHSWHRKTVESFHTPTSAQRRTRREQREEWLQERSTEWVKRASLEPQNDSLLRATLWPPCYEWEHARGAGAAALAIHLPSSPFFVLTTSHQPQWTPHCLV